jgi:hypothetical protein
VVGAVEVKVMVWEPLPTVKDCWTWGAAAVVGVAGLVGVDDAGAGRLVKETTPRPAIGAAGDEEASTVMATVRPEEAVAVGV